MCSRKPKWKNDNGPVWGRNEGGWHRVLSDTAAGSVNWYNFQTLPIEV